MNLWWIQYHSAHHCMTHLIWHLNSILIFNNRSSKWGEIFCTLVSQSHVFLFPLCLSWHLSMQRARCSWGSLQSLTLNFHMKQSIEFRDVTISVPFSTWHRLFPGTGGQMLICCGSQSIMISLITFTTTPRANQAITTVAGIATEGEIKLQNSDRKTETHTTIPRCSTNSLWNIKAPQRTQGVCIFKTHRYQKTETNIPTSEKGIFVKFSTAYMKLKLNLLFLLP